MKVIGKNEDDYIVTVSPSELEKFMGQYYGKMDRLKIGDDVDLGSGYDYMVDTKRAMDTTRKFIEDNGKIIDAIIRGLQIEEVGTTD